jgi:GMP synthase (glutamine-hydrolysing)
MALLIIQHSDSCTTGLLGDSLRRFGQRIRTVRVDRSEPLPANLEDIHGVVSLGGPQSANDSHAWIADELALLKAAHSAGIPILGICLGCQLLAKALGGQVARMDRPEIGWVKVTNTSIDKEDPLLAGLPWTQTVFAWHHDHVSVLPEGAALLQRSAACNVQAFRMGPWSYGIQYHPEWSRAMIQAEIAGASQDELAKAGVTADALRQATAEEVPGAERRSARMFELCNLVLFPATSLQTGLEARSPLHH